MAVLTEPDPLRKIVRVVWLSRCFAGLGCAGYGLLVIFDIVDRFFRCQPGFFMSSAKIACRFGVFLSLCLSANGVLAAEDELFFGELPVIASVSRLPQRIQDAPAAVTIIDRQMIKAMGMRDLNDLLRIVPGFQTFVRTTQSPRVTYHGILDASQSSRIQVLIDGRSQFSPLFDGGVNWSLLPVALEDIERIEVVRGSSAASFGGNAFQALVNIVTVDPSLIEGTSIVAAHGNQGVRDYTVRHGGRIGASGNFRATYQSKQDSGLREASVDPAIDGYQSQLFDLASTFAVSDRDSLQVGFGYMQSSMPHPDGDGSPSSPYHDQHWKTSYLQILWNRKQEEGRELQARFAHTEDRESQFYRGVFGVPFDFDPRGSRATRTELEVIERIHHQNLRVMFGTGGRQETMESPLYFDDDLVHSRSVGRIFSNLEWRPTGMLTGNLGVSLENDSVSGWTPAARAALNLHLDPQNTFRFGAFQSERYGSLRDYAGGRYVTLGAAKVVLAAPNPSLGQERISGYEIGYLGNWKRFGLALDARAFVERIPNRWFSIARQNSLCTSPGVVCLAGGSIVDHLKTQFPVELVDTHGFEYQLDWRPGDETRFVLNQTFVHVRADSLSQATSDPANSAMKFPDISRLTENSTPKRSTSLLLMQKLPFGVSASIFGQWVGRMMWTAQTSVMPFDRLDIRLAKSFQLGKKSAELAFTAQSINGSHYELRSGNATLPFTPNSFNLVERRQWLTLRLDL